MRILVFVLEVMGSLLACAQENEGTSALEKFQAGVHYQTIDTPLRTLSGKKVEVAELFQYGCPHCYDFEPIFDKWKKGAPDNVSLIKIPGTWGGIHAKIYYVAEMTGQLDTLHGKIFDAMHNDEKRKPHQIFKSEKEVKKFFLANGVSEESFNKEFNSASVKLALSFADSNIRSLSKQMARKGIKVSTPSVIVAGKYYITLNDKVRSFEAMLKVADFLIAKESSAQ